MAHEEKTLQFVARSCCLEHYVEDAITGMADNPACEFREGYLAALMSLATIFDLEIDLPAAAKKVCEDIGIATMPAGDYLTQ